MLEKIKDNKKELLILLLFTVCNLLFLLRGITKYALLSVIALGILIYKKQLEFKHYILLIHSIVYIVIGFVFALMNHSVNYMGISQAMIYLAAGFVAANFYSLSEKGNSSKLLDIYLYGICIAYAILYLLFNHENSIYYSGTTEFKGEVYWETHVYGYILGLYVVSYFCQKRYKHLALAMVFMLLEHKRIVDFAIVVTLCFVMSFKVLKKEESREKLYKFYLIAFFIACMVWIWMMKTDFLSQTLKLDDGFTSDRMTLWHTAVKYYEFTPTYIGKGIGWVKTWMSIEGLYGLDTLHNDFLVGYIELGFVGYIIWILSFIAIFVIMKKYVEKKYLYLGLCFFFYMFLNFLTDNAYIYISFMMPFYLFIISLFFADDREKYIKFFKRKSDKQ